MFPTALDAGQVRRTTRGRTAVFAGTALLFGALASGLDGQAGPGPGIRDTGLQLGAGAGTAIIPGPFYGGCDPRDDAMYATLAAGGEALLSIGSVALEVRATTVTDRWGFGALACIERRPFHPDGTHTDRSWDMRRGGLAMADLRIRTFPFGHRQTHLSAGIGSEWVRGLPYLVVGTGWQRAGRVRTGVDLDVRAVRVPYMDTTGEWLDGALVQIIDRESGHTLRFVGVVRVFFEIRLRSRTARPARARTAPS